MVDSINDFAAENRRRIKNTVGRFVELNADAERNLFFGVSRVEVVPTTSVQRRDTGDQIVAGSPDESKGFGRGTFGDDRGAFEDADDTIESEAALDAGLQDVARIVSEVTTDTVDAVGYGFGDGDANRLDTALEDRQSTTRPEVSVSGNTIQVRGVFDSTDVAGVDVEASVDLSSNALLSRSTATASFSPTEDVRVTVEFDIVGSGQGSAVFPDSGEARIASAIANETVSDILKRYSFLSGDEPDESATTVQNEEFETEAVTNRETNSVSVEGRVAAGEPPESFTPGIITAVAVVDDDDTILWATDIRDITVDDESAFTTDLSIRFI